MAPDDELPDPFDARASLGSGLPDYFRLSAVGDRLDLGRAPVTLKILLENALRHAGHGIVSLGPGPGVGAPLWSNDGFCQGVVMPFVILSQYDWMPA